MGSVTVEMYLLRHLYMDERIASYRFCARYRRTS